MVDQMKTELRARKSRPPTSLSNSPCKEGIIRRFTDFVTLFSASWRNRYRHAVRYSRN